MKQLCYSNKLSYLLAGLSLLALVAIIPVATRAEDEQGEQAWHHDEKFTLDAALDLTTVGPMGKSMFVRGESLVVDGILHPGGTLPTGLNANNDPNDGIVKGKIRCRATFLTDSTDFVSSFATFVSELYSLPDDGTHLLADGLGPNPGFTAHRIVSGGTGRFRGMVGEIEETDLGFNKTGGCNLRITFKLRKVEKEHHDH
jgi:hypothetical protein